MLKLITKFGTCWQIRAPKPKHFLAMAVKKQNPTQITSSGVSFCL